MITLVAYLYPPHLARPCRASMSERRRLVYSIIQFVQEEIRGDGLSEDAKESLEVPSNFDFLLFLIFCQFCLNL